ncbi:MAG: phosphatidate cytidylyltransferase [Clostridia bacterium]|nr:phosphatidate cytidylyltransferase [Clostridia bacterium]
MLTRILSGVVGAAILIGVVAAGQIALGIAIFILSVVGVHEFYKAVQNAGYRPIKWIGFILCIPILFLSLIPHMNINLNTVSDLNIFIGLFSLFIFAVLVVLLASIVFYHEKANITDVSLTFFGAVYVVFLFSFVVLTRNHEYGAYYIWLVFLGAFSTDTFAYFSGYFLGKRKLLPVISPKKTLEGSIGGIFGCVGVTLIYGIFINKSLDFDIALYHFMIMGALNGVVSQIGDWAASAIKRFVKIKDYGKMMPGHGGVLDRFDSILFTGPIVYFYITFMIH